MKGKDNKVPNYCMPYARVITNKRFLKSIHSSAKNTRAQNGNGFFTIPAFLPLKGARKRYKRKPSFPCARLLVCSVPVEWRRRKLYFGGMARSCDTKKREEPRRLYCKERKLGAK